VSPVGGEAPDAQSDESESEAESEPLVAKEEFGGKSVADSLLPPPPRTSGQGVIAAAYRSIHHAALCSVRSAKHATRNVAPYRSRN